MHGKGVGHYIHPIAPTKAGAEASLVNSSINTRSPAHVPVPNLHTFLYTQTATMIIDMRERIIHFARYINKLAETQAFAHLLNRTVYIARCGSIF